jgi:metallo-beta-lactamase class B
VKYILLILLGICIRVNSFAQVVSYKVSKDIEVIKITDNSYVHVSYTNLSKYGRVGSNGLIFTNNGKAVLFDTPMTESLTEELVDWIRDTLKVNIVEFIPNHWHEDCIGGLGYLNGLGIDSHANEMTIKIAQSKNLPVPKHGFKDSLTISLGDKKIICSYFGAAHSLDNIVAWIPSEKILFAGCMAKELASTNLGNTADGNLKDYPETIKKVLDKYPGAKYVIPGHGKFGGIELLKHTLDLSRNN